MTAVRWVSVLTLLLCAQCSRIGAVREQRVDAGLDGLERRERLDAKALELARAGVMPAKRQDKEAESFDEIKNLRRMSGAKHVISAVGKPDYVEEKDQMDILMPFLNHGDLQQMIVKCVGTEGCVCRKPQSGLCFEAMGKPWSKALILVYFYHAVQGVQEMHEKGLVHMDIKTQNIMLNCASADPTSCSAYLIDLGLGGPAGTLEVAGTPGFIAPEVCLLHYGRHTPAVKKGITWTRLSTLKYNPEKDDVIPKGKDQSAWDGLIVSESILDLAYELWN